MVVSSWIPHRRSIPLPDQTGLLMTDLTDNIPAGPTSQDYLRLYGPGPTRLNTILATWTYNRNIDIG
jgi:hypothetical protein